MRQELVGGRLAALLSDYEGKAVQARGDALQAAVEASNTLVDAFGARGMSHEGHDTVDPSEGTVLEAEGHVVAATAADGDILLGVEDFTQWLRQKYPDEAANFVEWLEENPDFLDDPLSNEDAANHPPLPRKLFPTLR